MMMGMTACQKLVGAIFGIPIYSKELREQIVEWGDDTDMSCGALLHSLLLDFTETERIVLDRRFGLSDGRSQTLTQVGESIGRTRERVRQIEAKALRKLRHPRRSRLLRELPSVEAMLGQIRQYEVASMVQSIEKAT